LIRSYFRGPRAWERKTNPTAIPTAMIRRRSTEKYGSANWMEDTRFANGPFLSIGQYAYR
jgi:hypothetical protein